MAVVLSVTASIPPFQLGAMTWFIAFAVMAIYLKCKREKILPHFNRPVSDYLFVGMGITLYMLLIYAAFHYSPPFEANTLNYLWPIFLMVFLSIFQGIPLTLVKWGGLLLGFAGCIILLGFRYGDSQFHGLTIGHISAVLAAIVWALYSCFAKQRDYPTAFMAPIFLISGVLSFIGHVLWEETVIPEFSIAFAIFIVGISRTSYVLWDYAIRQGDRQFITSLSYFIPLVSTVLMILFGFGSGNWLVLVAAFMIVLGCLIINSDKIAGIFIKKKPA